MILPDSQLVVLAIHPNGVTYRRRLMWRTCICQQSSGAARISALVGSPGDPAVSSNMACIKSSPL